MAIEKVLETVTVDGLDLYYTYRGYNNDIEVYTLTKDNVTYSLYQKPNESEWHCDWSKSYNCQLIDLEADATNKDAMLKAFVAMLKDLPDVDAGH